MRPSRHRQAALSAEGARLTALAEAVAGSQSPKPSERGRSPGRGGGPGDGFADLQDARDAVLPAAQLGELRAVAAEWQPIAARLRGAPDVDDFAGLAPSDAPAVIAAADTARAAALEAEQDARRLAVAAERARTAVARYAGARADVDAALVEHDEIARAAAPVVTSPS